MSGCSARSAASPPDGIARPATMAIDEHRAVPDPALESGAGEVAEEHRESLIQPLPRQHRRNLRLEFHRGRVFVV